MDEISLDTFP